MLDSSKTDYKRFSRVSSYTNISSGPIVPLDAESNLASLPMLLQTTLDLPQLLSLLFDRCLKMFGQCGLCYEHEMHSLRFQHGRNYAHHCNYQLEIDQLIIGKVSLSRRHRFSSDEIIMIENVLCKVVHPLRNCLLYQQALQIAKTDTLTGLPNRQAFEVMMEREIDLSKRLSLPICLLVIDVDHFKKINDTFGHTQGDQALIDVAARLLQSLRRSDITFRYGGEEFVVLMSHCNMLAAEDVAERLRNDIEKMNNVSADYGHMTISIGLTQYQTDEAPRQFFDRADKAMYQAKQLGRNQVVSFI